MLNKDRDLITPRVKGEISGISVDWCALPCASNHSYCRLQKLLCLVRGVTAPPHFKYLPIHTHNTHTNTYTYAYTCTHKHTDTDIHKYIHTHTQQTQTQSNTTHT